MKIVIRLIGLLSSLLLTAATNGAGVDSVRVSGAEEDAFRLSWDAVDGADGYVVNVWTNGVAEGPDMLFYNVLERRYYVIEVKVQKFDPADVGQIGTYMVAVNHQLKQPGDQQTVGLIICREKDRVTVQYALESSSLPIGVSDYVLERFIPADFQSQMPTIEEVEGELTRRMLISGQRREMAS